MCLFYKLIVPYRRKLSLHEIKVFGINANVMENDFQIKEINAIITFFSYCLINETEQ